jgi:hypothetical protein
MSKAYNWSWVQAQSASTIELWQNSAASFAPDLPQFTLKEQQRREKAFDVGMRDVERLLRKAPHGTTGRIGMQDKAVAAFARFSAAALGLEAAATALITGEFLPLGKEFARSARRFDPDLSMSDIVQACRNAWTACGLQPLLGEPMILSSSILGYSLLYPYSDNYLDRMDVSSDAKLRFSARFRARLRGEQISSQDDREASIWAAVALVEEQYPRLAFPQVYDSLLAIHQAQEESLAQLGGRRWCTDTEILRISCAKGGTSVLANACLARGWVSEEEALFSFEMGTLLQLGDDLQDLREDLQHGFATLFTVAVERGAPLDRLVAQLLNFHELVATHMESLPHGSPTLRRLLRTSWRSLILGAVAHTQDFFSPGHLNKLEASSPFRFAFLRDRSKKLTGRRGLYKTLFEACVEAPDIEAAKACEAAIPLPRAGQLLFRISE